MLIGVIGINHKSADLSLREELAKTALKRFGADCSFHGALSYVLLTTCNRTEIYFSSEEPATTHTYLLNTLRADIDYEFEHRIYSYFGADCFLHLARVTAGMDSAIIGESEIQGQVKQAYESAAKYRHLSSEIHFLFQKSLKIGKELRTLFFSLMPSLEETLLTLATSFFGSLENKKVLFVGVSEVNLKILKRFKEQGLKKIAVCNRTFNRAFDIVKKELLQLLDWSDLSQALDFDLVIVGTKSQKYLLTSNPRVDLFAERKLVIDLSVPRNVDPSMGKVKGVTLLNIDQINRCIDHGKKKAALKAAHMQNQIIASKVEKHCSSFKTRHDLVFEGRG